MSKSDVGTYSYTGNQGTNYANPNAVTQIASTTYTYDNNGNLKSDGTWTHTWDYRNRIVQSVKPGTATTTVRYTYDDQDSRVQYSTNGKATTTTINKLYEVTGATTTKYIYANNKLVATIENGNTYYDHTDHLSGSNVITNSTGNVQELLDYQPFGSIRLDEKSGNFNERKKFTGHEYDADTGLNYMQARYQNGAIGRFVSLDPVFNNLGSIEKKKQNVFLVDPQGLNSYSYVKNNPLRYIDPTGEDAVVTVNEKSSTITVKSNIYIYGKDASDSVAKQMQADIMKEWNKGWNYYDSKTEKTYSVKFDISVKVTSLPLLAQIGDANNAIEIDNSARSNVDVDYGYQGTWRGNSPDAAPHEFGHLVGLNDRYTDLGGTNSGWGGNIMAEPAMKGGVEQRNIDAIVSPYVEKHDQRWFKFINKATSYHLAPRGKKDYN